jgi:hypothetical protein
MLIDLGRLLSRFRSPNLETPATMPPCRMPKLPPRISNPPSERLPPTARALALQSLPESLQRWQILPSFFMRRCQIVRNQRAFLRAVRQVQKQAAQVPERGPALLSQLSVGRWVPFHVKQSRTAADRTRVLS